MDKVCGYCIKVDVKHVNEKEKASVTFFEQFVMEGKEAAYWLAKQGADLDGGAMATNKSCNSKARKHVGACAVTFCCHFSLPGGTLASRSQTETGQGKEPCEHQSEWCALRNNCG